MRLGAYPCRLKHASRVAHIYAATAQSSGIVSERHRHRYEFNHAYQTAFEENGLECVGINPDSELVEILCLKNHRWYIGVQFHPEYASTVLHPHPLFVDFVKNATQITQ